MSSTPLVAQILAALQTEGRIPSYVGSGIEGADKRKGIPLNLIDGDDINITWNNALEKLKQGIELDRDLQHDNWLQAQINTGQVTPEDIRAVIDPLKVLEWGAKMHAIPEELWRTPEGN